MAGIKNTLVKALALYLMLAPCLGLRAEAQASGPIDPPRPFDPPGLGGPRPQAGGGTVFTAAADSLVVRSFNGFSTESVPGFFSHRGHVHDGGLVDIDSPWGETLAIRYWLTPHGITFEYDEDLKVRYHFDDDGTLAEIVAQTPEREARMAVGKRAELAYLGQRDFSSFDMSAYVLIEESLRSKHSDAFLSGVAEIQGVAEASCATKAIACAACILAWAATVPAIAGACVVAGVVTFGLACFAAILAHEATTFACAATCIEMVEECRGRPQGRVIPEGCEP